MTGVVARKNEDRGYGFLTPSGNGKDVFFHASQLVNVEFEDVSIGDKMEFDMGEGKKGPCAVNIRMI